MSSLTCIFITLLFSLPLLSSPYLYIHYKLVFIALTVITSLLSPHPYLYCTFVFVFTIHILIFTTKALITTPYCLWHLSGKLGFFFQWQTNTDTEHHYQYTETQKNELIKPRFVTLIFKTICNTVFTKRDEFHIWVTCIQLIWTWNRKRRDEFHLRVTCHEKPSCKQIFIRYHHKIRPLMVLESYPILWFFFSV